MRDVRDPFGEVGNQSCGFDDRILFPSEFILEHMRHLLQDGIGDDQANLAASSQIENPVGQSPKLRAEM